VATDDPQRRAYPITIDGKRVAAKDVIGFQGWHDGIRHHGSRILRTALALEKAAKRYADTPLPSMVLKNTSTYELDDTEITELLAGVKAARNTDAVGYINAGIELDTTGWDASELQLVEARMFTSAQIANLVGVPAGLIAGASASGSTLTYQNVAQDNRAFIDFGLSPALKAIESRLSMSDVMGKAWAHQVTPRGTVLRFNLQGILRGNPLERAQIYSSLIEAGVITAAEARLMEDLAPEGRQEA
jgi:HK97 family phage portal protein